MKKYILLGTLLCTALAFTSCSNEDYKDWAKPQASGDAAEGSAYSYGISMNAGPQAEIVMPVADDDITIATIQSEKTLPFEIKSFTINGKELDIYLEGNAIKTSAARLDSLVEATNFSRAAIKREMEAEVFYSVLDTDQKDSLTFKNVVKLAVTPAATPEIDPQGYFVLGDFEGIGWNPPTAGFMQEVEDGVYSVVVTTTGTGSNWFKFYCGSTYKGESTTWDDINPKQMGCIEDGDDATENLLVWTGDPRGLEVKTPVIKGAGKWKITLDMKNCTYTVKEKLAGLDDLYLTGSNYNWGATKSDWKKVNAINNNWGGTSEGEFWTIIYLHAGEMFKFAPQQGWGGDFGGTGLTVTDKAGAGYVDDGTNCKVTNPGWYLLHVKTADMEMIIEKPKVYLIGDCIGGWEGFEQPFTTPTDENGEFVSPAFTNSGNVRMYTLVEGAAWWRCEYNIFDGAIVIRTEGDQPGVPGTAGQKAYLNFTTMTGKIQ